MSVILSSVGRGVRAARRRPLLTVLAWAANALLAATIALPFFSVTSAGLGHSRESAAALESFNLRVLWEVFHYDRSPGVGALLMLVVALLLLWLVVSSFLAAGIVQQLLAAQRDPEDGTARTDLADLFGGGVRLFWRYLRLALLTLVFAGIAEFVLGLAAAPLLARLGNSSWEPSWILATVLGAAQFVVIAGLFALVLDYARIEIAITGRRSALGSWWLAVRYFMRRPLATGSIRLGATVAAAVILGVSLLIQTSLGSASWLGILVLAAVQQATIAGRTAVRVAEIGAELALAGTEPVLVRAAVPEARGAGVIEE